MALCNLRYFPDNFHSCFKYAVDMIRFQRFSGKSELLTYQTYNDLCDLGYRLDLSGYFDSQKLCKYLFAGNRDLAKKYVSDSLDIFYNIGPIANLYPLKMTLLREIWMFECSVFKYEYTHQPVGEWEIHLGEEFEAIFQTENRIQLLRWCKTHLDERIDQVELIKIPSYIKRAKQYIESNYRNDIKLNDIANEVFLNEWYLSTQFKKHTGMSVVNYINLIRIEHAIDILIQDEVKICDLAAMVGFNDCSYFSKVFRQVTQVTLGSIRSSIKNIATI